MGGDKDLIFSHKILDFICTIVVFQDHTRYARKGIFCYLRLYESPNVNPQELICFMKLLIYKDSGTFSTYDENCGILILKREVGRDYRIGYTFTFYVCGTGSTQSNKYRMTNAIRVPKSHESNLGFDIS